MIRPSRTTRAAVAVAATALLLSACGSDNSSSDKPTTSPTKSQPSSSGPASSPSGTATPMVFGELFPETGDLAYLGPPQFAGAALAIKDINAAGGVLGKPVTSVKGDEGDGTPDLASGSVDKLLNANVNVILGAAASSVSLSVIDKIIGAGVMEISGSNTSPAFDTYDDKGLYFRTAPSDALQGTVLGNLITEDKHTNVAILARQDSYGEGLADQLAKTLQSKGATVAIKKLYSADATNFTADVNAVAATHPDALALISFSEGEKIIPQLIAAGIGPQDVPMYTVDGDTVDYSKVFDPGTMAGTKGTIPVGADLGNVFQDRLKGIDPKLKDFTYGPQVYDATILAALAADAAGSTDGKAIAAKMTEVSSGGTACSSYKQCLAMLKAGKDINYEGVSGPVDMNSNGSPSKATIGINLYGKDNTFKQIDTVTGVLP
jgi:ABC-type branched-subunit amino acid transport system substrate-binding protein